LAAGADVRLKTELTGGDIGAFICGAAGAGLEAGIDRSNKSPMPELAAGFGGGEVCCGTRDPKSPNPLDWLMVLTCGAGGLDGFGGDLGVVSKKPPPPPKVDAGVADVCELARGLEKLARSANADGLGCCWTGAVLKDSPPKASFNPPNPEDVDGC
jgi:hypothetical protein